MIWLVLLIAFILRFYQLGSIPPAVDWDEASTAYNGYSILKTGKDEFGQSFPILFRAFDGYVPPVLVYLNSLSTAILGLNELAARLPNALLGTITVLGVYLLVKKLSANEKWARLSAFLLAISPYHIIYSRVNLLPNLPIIFITFGVLFFLKGLSKKTYFYLSATTLVLAIFSYYSAYIFVPLLAAVLILVYRQKLKTSKALLFISPIILASVLILFVIPGGQNRLRGISVFSDPDLIRTSAVSAGEEGIVGRLLHNRRLVYTQEFLGGYFSNFRFDFLFAKGDTVKRQVIPGSGFGLMYLWDFFFLIFGLWSLAKAKPKGWNLFLTWLILAPIAAAWALPQPASTRTTVILPVLSIITAYGFWYFAGKLPKIVIFGLFLMLTFNFLLFSEGYFRHFSRARSNEWFYGYRQLYNYLNKKQNVNKNVYFFFKQHDSLDQVHIFTLFYNRIDPATYQASGGTKLGCNSTTGQFSIGRYHFEPYQCLTTPIDFSKIEGEALVVTSRPLDNVPLDQVRFLDGSSAFQIYEYRHVQDAIKKFIAN